MDYKIIKLDISTGKAHYAWFVSGIDLYKAGTQIFIRFSSIPQPFAVFADNVDPLSWGRKDPPQKSRTVPDWSRPGVPAAAGVVTTTYKG